MSFPRRPAAGPCLQEKDSVPCVTVMVVELTTLMSLVRFRAGGPHVRAVRQRRIRDPAALSLLGMLRLRTAVAAAGLQVVRIAAPLAT